VERLACADKQRIDSARAAAAHAHYSGFSFQPRINERSRRIVRVRQPCSAVLRFACGEKMPQSRHPTAKMRPALLCNRPRW
jgi:hypothetical protein